MMSERLKEYTEKMILVKKGKYCMVYYNPSEKMYEIWDRIEQLDFCKDKAEAIAAMRYLDKNYMTDLY